MRNETMITEAEAALSSRQAVLLDELTARLSHVQVKLEAKDLTIHAQEAERIVKNHVLAGSAMGLMPLPLFDLVSLSGIQYTMLEQLCQHYGVAFNRHKIRATLLAVLGGASPTLTLAGLGSAFKFVPGIGTLAGNAGLTLLGGAITYAIGQSFSKHFRNGGTLEDVNVRKLRDLLRKEYKSGKTLLTRAVC